MTCRIGRPHASRRPLRGLLSMRSKSNEAELVAPRRLMLESWCRRADLNRQPIAYEAIALPLSYCGPARLVAKKPAAVEAALLEYNRYDQSAIWRSFLGLMLRSRAQ